jgi:hypothetical protein
MLPDSHNTIAFCNFLDFLCLSWRKVEVNCTYLVRNEEVFHGVKEERNILPAIQRREFSWIGYILHRNCLLKLGKER